MKTKFGFIYLYTFSFDIWQQTSIIKMNNDDDDDEDYEPLLKFRLCVTLH